ncbi:TetR/AcrR family transcriptional regulator [soil metagenome]
MSSSVVSPLDAPAGVAVADSSVPHSTESTRRRLSTKQAQTVQKLVVAAVEELREQGYDGLTVRNVARRAGVAPATAYNYFTSREHLVTEVFWRRLQGLPETRVDMRRTAAGRAVATMTDLALLVADEPELASACTVAMLSNDPDVKLLRDRIGVEWHRRLAHALGDPADPAVLGTLEFAMSGAMVQAGMGHMTYEELPAKLAKAVQLVVPDGR